MYRLCGLAQARPNYIDFLAATTFAPNTKKSCRKHYSSHRAILRKITQ